jgi:hypothetical protein
MEDVFNRRPDATERLVDFRRQHQGTNRPATAAQQPEWRSLAGEGAACTRW